MSIKNPQRIALPDYPDDPETETKTERSTGWYTRFKNRIKLAMEGDDEDMLIVNNTAIAWKIHHKYHFLGIVEPGESEIFKIRKNGNLSACPNITVSVDPVDYLVVDLNSGINYVVIYLKSIGNTVEVYDMRAA
jgi:hypothetical protein